MKKILMTSIVVLVFAFLCSFLLMACRHEAPTSTPTPTSTPIPDRELEDALLDSVSPDLPAPIATWAVECKKGKGKGVAAETELFLLTEEKVFRMSEKFFVLMPDGRHLVFDENYKPLGKHGCTLKRLVLPEPEGDGMGKIPETLPKPK